MYTSGSVHVLTLLVVLGIIKVGLLGLLLPILDQTSLLPYDMSLFLRD